jgi:hypothetical protein
VVTLYSLKQRFGCHAIKVGEFDSEQDALTAQDEDRRVMCSMEREDVCLDLTTLLVGPGRDFSRTWPNQKEVSVRGIPFYPGGQPARDRHGAQFLRSRRITGR